MTKLFLAVFLLAIGGCASLFSSSPEQRIARIRNGPSPLLWVSAHRGVAEGNRVDSLPENSIAALKESDSLGIHLFEVDVRLSADKIPFLFHDARYRIKTPNYNQSYLPRPFDSITSKEIFELCARVPKQSCPPTLHQVLSELKNAKGILQLDVKGVFRETFLEIYRELELQEFQQLVIQCPSVEDFRYLRTNFPQLTLLARVFSEEEALQVLKLKPEIIQLDYEDLNPSLLETIQQAGTKVLIKTLDPGQDVREVWVRLYNQGVDILLSDHALEVLQLTKELRAGQQSQTFEMPPEAMQQFP